MYVGRDFDEANPGEAEPFTLDFARELATGETIVSVTWTCTAVNGGDPDAGSRLIGVAQVQGTKSVQQAGNFLSGRRYLLLATIQTSQGNTKILYSHVTCCDPS